MLFIQLNMMYANQRGCSGLILIAAKVTRVALERQSRGLALRKSQVANPLRARDPLRGGLQPPAYLALRPILEPGLVVSITFQVWSFRSAISENL